MYVKALLGFYMIFASCVVDASSDSSRYARIERAASAAQWDMRELMKSNSDDNHPDYFKIAAKLKLSVTNQDKKFGKICANITKDSYASGRHLLELRIEHAYVLVSSPVVLSISPKTKRVKIKNALVQAYAHANNGNNIDYRHIADQLESQVTAFDKHGYDKALAQATENHNNQLGSWIMRSLNNNQHELNLKTQAVKNLLADRYKYNIDELPKKQR